MDGVRGVGPDGSVVYEHNAYVGEIAGYRIAAVSPPPGTLIGRNDSVTVNIVGVDKTAPSQYSPCDWVTTAEAERFFGGISVTTHTEGTEMGSTDVRCHYDGTDNNGPGVPHEATSELRLLADHVVDAASEFAFRTAEDSMSVEGVGIKAACTVTRNRSIRRLFVLLPDERIYIVTGWAGGSCDTLKQFAQAAIPRIGAWVVKRSATQGAADIVSGRH
jgi:hypothetical protein